MKIKMLVTMKLPPGATAKDVVSYTREALYSWGGSLEPPRPFDLAGHRDS